MIGTENGECRDAPARIYSSASVLPISCESLRSCVNGVNTSRTSEAAHIYSIMPSNHRGRNQSFRRDAFGIALVLTCRVRM